MNVTFNGTVKLLGNVTPSNELGILQGYQIGQSALTLPIPNDVDQVGIVDFTVDTTPRVLNLLTGAYDGGAAARDADGVALAFASLYAVFIKVKTNESDPAVAQVFGTMANVPTGGSAQAFLCEDVDSCVLFCWGQAQAVIAGAQITFTEIGTLSDATVRAIIVGKTT